MFKRENVQPQPEKVTLVELLGFKSPDYDPRILSEAQMTLCSGFPSLCMASCGLCKGLLGGRIIVQVF